MTFVALWLSRAAKFLGAVMMLAATVRCFAEDAPRYNRDVLPILSQHCFTCHGPDQQARRGGVRLDQRNSALAKSDSGNSPIVPREPEGSSLIARVFSNDSALVMPPADHNKSLSPQQKETLRRWIETGAEYEVHWSLLPVQRPPTPHVFLADWGRNEIDAFILSRLEAERLKPSPAAAPERLIRRLSLDLLGLPPSPQEVEQFVAETSATEPAHFDQIYLQWVDRFLDSPRYGERMAVDWLDAARYADSNGYQVDRDRDMSAWRDWVIGAFNANLPFDQFTIEQLAGDLLPNATVQQKIATGFHRNHMLNEEGGIIDAEFLAEYCADRVETTAAIWLGQTFTCARCHDHKFDPFTQRDYYGLYAFFHNVSERGVGNYGAAYRRSAPPFLILSTPELEQQLSQLRSLLAEGQESLKKFDEKLRSDQPSWEAAIRLQLEATTDAAKEANSKIPAEITTILNKEPAARSDAELKQLTVYHQSSNVERKPISDRIAELTKQAAAVEASIPTAMVMEELPAPRETRILMRGVYSRLGEAVTAGAPAALPQMADGLPRNRLGLARWLVDPRNPLPARVTVNRLWQSIFGTGLVRTAEDFGTQGSPPSHPELLDWLAHEFVRSGWNVKHLIRLIVSSSTYRQSSVVSKELAERDPENRWLARGPRFRLQAEFLRDQALAVSGLLVSKIGGPSVKPYHPPGLYEQVTAGSGTDVYIEGKGDDLYRRSLYTYWKRSVPHPAMLAFDAPFREACTLRRSRTNTPMQALNLLNDPTYVEAARFLAQRMLTEGGTDLSSQLTRGYRLVLARAPRQAELAILSKSYHRALREFEADPKSVEEFLKVGANREANKIPAVPLAAMTVVASALLNLDETVMKD